jgi:hypothetical protein
MGVFGREIGWRESKPNLVVVAPCEAKVCLVWLLSPKNQKATSRNQLFLKDDFLAVQN